MNVILFLYILGVAIVGTLLYRSNNDYSPEFIIFLSVFYPVIIALGVVTILMMGILALICAITTGFKIALGGIKNANK